MNTLIVAGYNGIMDLDLSRIDPKHRRQAIQQHERDIELYRAEQELLKPEHRYENTIVRVQKQLEYEKRIQLQRMNTSK